jgi:hypothetical protein
MGLLALGYTGAARRVRESQCHALPKFVGADVWVSRERKRNPADSWAPLERIESSSQAEPTFVLEVGMSEGQASLDAVAEEYLTGDLADKVRASLTPC